MESEAILSRRKKFLFRTIMVLLPLSFFALAYLVYTGYRSAQMYRSLKENRRGWEGNAHTSDPQLGYAPVPNGEGARVTPHGPNIPVRYDRDGFRVPMQSDDALDERPLIMSLGCSFTYGDLNVAEDAFPYLVGRSMNGTSKNAAVCGYGLAQMMLLAEDLLPKHRPDYLLVQYSPWLLQRARSPFAPSLWAKMPTPFFYDEDDGFAVHPPVFLSINRKLPIDRYRQTSSSWMDGISFFWSVGLPQFFHDDINMLRYHAAKVTGIVPEPTSSSAELTEHVYARIGAAAAEIDARLVIVVLGRREIPVNLDETLFPPDALIVRAHDDLLEQLDVVSWENYLKEFGHPKGFPMAVDDLHPNKAAHKLIANSVVSAILKDAEKPPNQDSQISQQEAAQI